MITGRVTNIEMRSGEYRDVDAYGNAFTHKIKTGGDMVRITIEVPVEAGREEKLKNFYYNSSREPVNLKLQGERWDYQWDAPHKNENGFPLSKRVTAAMTTAKDKPTTEDEVW